MSHVKTVGPLMTMNNTRRRERPTRHIVYKLVSDKVHGCYTRHEMADTIRAAKRLMHRMAPDVVVMQVLRYHSNDITKRLRAV